MSSQGETIKDLLIFGTGFVIGTALVSATNIFKKKALILMPAIKKATLL